MRVVPPLEITAALLTSSTATEPWAPAAYDAGTTYALGDIRAVAADFTIYESLAAGNLGNTPNISPTWWRVLGPTETAYAGGTTYALGDTVSSGHRVYESLQAGNTGNTPLISPTWWLDVGATNKWRSIDLERNSATVFASPLTIVITPGARINSCALLGVVADDVTISMTSVIGGGTVYSYTEDLSTREVFDWYDYFFEPFSTRESVVRFDLPPYTDGILTISLTRSSGNVSLGALVIGTYVYLGEAQYNATSDTLNFSTVTRDEFGNSTLVPRRNVPRTNQVVMVAKSRVNKVRAVRDDLNATPALWSALDDSTDGYADALLILGIYKQFSIDVDYPELAAINLELEEI